MNLFGDVNDLDEEMQTALKSDFVNNLLMGGIMGTGPKEEKYISDEEIEELPKFKVYRGESTLDLQLRTKAYVPVAPIAVEKEGKEDIHHTLTLDDLDWNVCIDQWDKAINYDKYNKSTPTNYYMLLFPVPNYHLIHNMQHKIENTDKCALLLDQNDPYLHIDYSTLTQPRKKLVIEDALSSIKQKFNGYMYQLNSVRQTMQYQLNHSDIAKKLYPVFYPLHYTKFDLRHYHRPPYHFKPNLIQFQPLKQSKKKIVFAKDVLLRDGKSILLEYSEEYPLLMQNTGMISLVQNFHRQLEDDENPVHQYGSLINLEENETSPLFGFGDVVKNEPITCIVNNLFRAPIVQHKPLVTDFLFIHYEHKQQSKYYLKELPDLFVVGQQLPASEIQPPQSRKHLLLMKSRVKQAAFRLIQKHPKRILHIESLQHMLPGYSESHLKSKLRDFMVPLKHKKHNYWTLKQGIVIPDELDELCTPEQHCLHHSMLAGEQRLRDLGFNSIRDDENDFNMELEEQVAGWIITRNFINAVQNKTMLQLYGQGDPTGCGLGFSFIKTTAKDVFLRENETMEDRMKELSNRPKNSQKFTIAEQQNIYHLEINKIFQKQMQDLKNTAIDDVSSQIMDTMPLMELDDHTSLQNEARSTRSLVITRKYPNDEERQEIVRDPQVINQYLQIRNQVHTKPAPEEKSEAKIRKCRACGSTTHIKTSKLCPMNKNHLEHLEKERNKKRKSTGGKRLGPQQRLTCKQKLNQAFSKITVQFTNNVECYMFNHAVTDDIAPNYSAEVKQPMDFNTILKKCQDAFYNDKEEYLLDVQLIKTNCEQYNGMQSPFSLQAAKWVQLVEKKVQSSKKIPEIEALITMGKEIESVEPSQQTEQTPIQESSSDLEDLEALLNQDDMV